MPNVVRREHQRRRGKGPEVSTGRGITASGDKRFNVRVSTGEAESIERAARKAGAPSAAAWMREVALVAAKHVEPTPEHPITSAPIPWLVPVKEGSGEAKRTKPKPKGTGRRARG